MLTTLKQAKQIICPELSGEDCFVKCLGADCMFWRWKDIEMLNYIDRLSSHPFKKKPEVWPSNIPEYWLLQEHYDGSYSYQEDDDSYYERLAELKSKWPTEGRRGYCGKAGKPEIE